MTRPLPVLQLIDGFATEEHPGGAAQFGIQLARHLDRSRYQPFVCGLWRYNTRSESRWIDQLEREGIHTSILVDTPRRLSTDFVRAMALLRELTDQIKPAIINSHFERGDVLGMWSKLSHPDHPRIVRTMHADQQWQQRPWLGALLNVAALPWLFDAEVAISEATRQVMDQRVAARLRGRRAVRIYNGISSDLIRSSARRADARDRADAPRIAIVGRLAQQKGHGYFLQAAQIVARTWPRAEFWIIGTGDLQAELEAQAAALGIAPAVRFWGQRSDVRDLLDQSDLLVSASIWEGFPTVVLEAMAAGLPVVATDVSGSRELIRTAETGVLVPPTDVPALGAAILRLINDRAEADRLADRAWAEVRQFTLDATAHAYDQLYDQIVKISTEAT